MVLESHSFIRITSFLLEKQDDDTITELDVRWLHKLVIYLICKKKIKQWDKNLLFSLTIYLHINRAPTNKLHIYKM